MENHELKALSSKLNLIFDALCCLTDRVDAHAATMNEILSSRYWHEYQGMYHKFNKQGKDVK